MLPSLTARVRATLAGAEPTANGHSSEVSISASKARAPRKELVEVRESFAFSSLFVINELSPELAADLGGEMERRLLPMLPTSSSSRLLDELNASGARSPNSQEGPW